MWEAITGPWPWYVSGPLLGLMVPLLLVAGNKNFGISSTLRHICSATIPTKATYFATDDWRGKAWNLIMALGVVLGGVIAVVFLGGNRAPQVTDAAIELFASWNVSEPAALQPAEIYAAPGAFTVRGLVSLVAGGFLVGFGTRYANGCTSGHAIMGLSLLNPGSLVATLGFFAGGVVVSNYVLPWVMSL